MGFPTAGRIRNPGRRGPGAESDQRYLDFLNAAIAEGWPDLQSVALPDDVRAAIAWASARTVDQARRL